MKRSLCILLGLIAGLSGCNSDEEKPADTVTAQEAARAAKFGSYAVLIGYPSLTTWLGGQGAAGKSFPEASDGLFGLTCPVVTVSNDVTYVDVVLNYGTGCTSELDGQPHAGVLKIRRPNSGGGFTFLFTNYETGDYTVDGAIDAAFADAPAAIRPAADLPPIGLSLAVTDLNFSGAEGITTVDANLFGTWDDHATRTDLSDDSWQIHGTAGNVADIVVTATDQKIYSIDIATDHPVVLLAGCAWPVSGVVTLTVSEVGSDKVSPPTTLDFGAGNCDDLALVTVAGVSRGIHLSTGEFVSTN